MATLAPAHDLHLHIDPDSDEYKEMERRIVRKQDWRIMPLICLSYLLSASTSSSSSTSPRRHDLTRSRARRLPRASFCDCRYLSCCDLRAARTQDRTNLGVARTLNSDKPGESLVETLNLKGLRYNAIVAVFFVPCKLLSMFLSPRRSEELTLPPPSLPPSLPHALLSRPSADVLFEFPSNLALKRFTPSKWIARIMVSWGASCARSCSSLAGSS